LDLHRDAQLLLSLVCILTQFDSTPPAFSKMKDAISATTAKTTQADFDPIAVRADFPILNESVRNGKPLVYLDSAATAQKPLQVLQRLQDYYAKENANIHRGVHFLSEQATEAYEAVRLQVAHFMGIEDAAEIIFVRGATEGINLVAHGFAQSVLKPGDEILLTHMEHHANIVPWQLAAERTGATVKVIPVDDDGDLDLGAFESLLGPRTRILAFTHISNALGTVNPAKHMIDLAHRAGVPVLLDGAQSFPHIEVSQRELDWDFAVFSGHKVFGPTGIGVLHGKREWLERFPPYQSGGDMIEKVRFEGTTFKNIPGKFEAGTPHIAGVIGLGAAIDYLSRLDRRGAEKYEHHLLELTRIGLNQIKGVRIIGNAAHRAGAVSFVIDDTHAHDIGTFLDADGIAIRAGHHCTQPLLARFGLAATARASFSIYNNENDVQQLLKGIERLMRFF
jgi:cysteine desulfurase/selenocysteine lyase